MDRRELFGSFVSALADDTSKTNQERLFRPPYHHEESLFLSECHQCEGRCSAVCEEGIIKISQDKTPYLSFVKSGCTYCDACADACEFGVLKVQDKAHIPAKISINETSCLSWNMTMCFSCKDPCLDNAIIFEGLFKPYIDEKKCSACGFCISRCPVAAIDIEGLM